MNIYLVEKVIKKRSTTQKLYSTCRMETPYHIVVSLRDTNVADKMNQFLPWTRLRVFFRSPSFGHVQQCT